MMDGPTIQHGYLFYLSLIGDLSFTHPAGDSLDSIVLLGITANKVNCAPSNIERHQMPRVQTLWPGTSRFSLLLKIAKVQIAYSPFSPPLESQVSSTSISVARAS